MPDRDKKSNRKDQGKMGHPKEQQGQGNMGSSHIITDRERDEQGRFIDEEDRDRDS